MTSASSPAADLGDALLEEHVENALAPYRDLLPPEDLAAFREMLVLFYTEHPAAVEALADARAMPAMESSGTVLRRDETALAEASARRNRRVRGGAA